MNIGPVGAELFHVDRQTDGRTKEHDEANSRFSQFCERAQNLSFLLTQCIYVFHMNVRIILPIVLSNAVFLSLCETAAR